MSRPLLLTLSLSLVLAFLFWLPVCNFALHLPAEPEGTLHFALTPSPLLAQEAFPSPTSAPPTSEATYQQLFSDYQFQLNLYRQAHDDYQLARDRYLQFKTLTTKQETLESFRQLLKARNTTVKTYLLALKTRLQNTPGVTPLQQVRYTNYLNQQVAFIDSIQSQADSFATLPDGFKISQQFDSRYLDIEVLSYEILHTILMGRQLHLKDQVQLQINTTKTLLSRMASLGGDTTKEQRWALEADNRLLRHQQKLSQSLEQLALLKKNRSNRPDQFTAISLTLQEANQYLKETVSFLKETLREVKRG